MTGDNRSLFGKVTLLSSWIAVAGVIAAAPSDAQNMGPDFGARGDDNKGSIELIDPKVLRVCADPKNLPFSNEAGEGFENKIAQLLAARLGKELAYTFYPGASGFVRNTLNAHLCDVVLGIPQGNDLVQPTNPYYRTTYAVVARAGSELDGLKTLTDPRLKEKPRRIGLVANTPPGNILAANSLLASVKPYPLMVDTRFDSSSLAMVQDLKKGDIDIGVLWGPIAGYYAKNSSGELRATPLLEETGARMSFRIAFGVRHSDQNWKRELNQFLAQNKDEVEKILLDFGVPLLDELGKEITIAAPERALKLAQVSAVEAPAMAPPPEPEGYRPDPLHGPTPATLKGATVLDTAHAVDLWTTKQAIFVDTLSRPPKPAGLPPNALWRYPPRFDIPGSVWLPDTGYAELAPETLRFFETGLARATGEDKNKALVFYCRTDCWASWNAAKRALSLGYTKVSWYPAGADGWEKAGHPLEERQPEWRSP